MADDDTKAIGPLGRQEILTILIAVVFGIIATSAATTMYMVFSHPQLADNIVITGDVDIGAFVNKMVESYDAFLVLLGVGVGAGVGGAIASARARNPGTQRGRDNDTATYQGQIMFLQKELIASENELEAYKNKTDDFSKMMTALINREIAKTRRELQEKERYLQDLMNKPGWHG